MGRMFKRPAHWLIYIGIWVLMALYYTTWDMVAYHMGFLTVLPLNLCQNAVWALEGLLIIRIAGRYPIESFSRRSLGNKPAIIPAAISIARTAKNFFSIECC